MGPQMISATPRADVADFILGLRWDDVPARVRRRICFLLRDFVAVSVAGRATPTGAIAADYAAAEHPGRAARSFFDGREGPIGKKWNIRFLPTIYVLDHKGVIRYKGVRDKDMDVAVDTLIKDVDKEKK